ncbi:MAG: P-II family nitrogen regulator [Vicinamibacterales bacterium]
MQEVKAIIRPERLDEVLHALHELPELPGVTVSGVRGIGRRVGAEADEVRYGETAMMKLEIVLPARLVELVVTVIESAARTGRPGDGKIFVHPVTTARRIRTGETDSAAV